MTQVFRASVVSTYDWLLCCSKIPGVPIMNVARGKYVIERLPDAPEKWFSRHGDSLLVGFMALILISGFAFMALRFFEGYSTMEIAAFFTWRRSSKFYEYHSKIDSHCFSLRYLLAGLFSSPARLAFKGYALYSFRPSGPLVFCTHIFSALVYLFLRAYLHHLKSSLFCWAPFWRVWLGSPGLISSYCSPFHVWKSSRRRLDR